MSWSFEKRYLINTLKLELSTTKTYEHNRLDETSIVDRHRCHMAAKFGVFVDENHSNLLLTLVCAQLLSCQLF